MEALEALFQHRNDEESPAFVEMRFFVAGKNAGSSE
jgi:hypothetical protein